MKLNKRKKDKKIYILLLVVFIIVLLLKVEINIFENFVNNIFLPIKKTVYRINTKTKNRISDLVYIKEVIDENKELRYQNYILKLEKLKWDKLDKENKRLRELLNIKEEKKMEFIFAEIIYRNAMEFYQNMIINKGKKDGIKKDMVVLNKDVLLGKIVEVNEKTSRVALITKKDFYVSVLTTDNKNLGILEGQNQRNLELKNIITDSDIKKGDKIKTSGLSNIYPKDILVGEVSDVKKDEGQIFKSIEVKLLYNLLNLNEVIILKKGGKE